MVPLCTGIPGGSRPIQINGAELIQDLVLNNQVVIGSVNDAPGHFQMAVRDLLTAHRFYGDLLRQLITHRYPPEKFEDALKDHGTDEIKVVIQWKDICE